jgi:hypothetical protein
MSMTADELETRHAIINARSRPLRLAHHGMAE